MMGKVTDATISAVPGEHIPLLCQTAPNPTYLSQEEVVHQARAAPWQRVRRALLCLLGGLFVSMLTSAVLLLVTMPRMHSSLPWWQKSSFYHLPPTDFPDSNRDGHGDLEGVRLQLSQFRVLPVQALVLGQILEADNTNLTTVCPAFGSLEKLRELVDEGDQKGIQILLELPLWEEEVDPVAEDNRTAQTLSEALRFWQAQGVDGFMVAKDPAWRLDVVLAVWRELDRELRAERGQEGVLLVWDQSEACNVSRQMPGRVVLVCHLPGAQIDLTAEALSQKVEAALRHPHGPWPGWTLPRTVPLKDDLGEILGVLLLTLPGVPLVQGGAGVPLPLDQKAMANSGSGGHPLANLLALRAKLSALQGLSFAPLDSHAAETLAFFRPGSCSGVLVLLNLGSQYCQLSLGHLGFPTHLKVLFSTHPDTQPEANLEHLRPHQGILLQVPGGRGP